MTVGVTQFVFDTPGNEGVITKQRSPCWENQGDKEAVIILLSFSCLPCSKDRIYATSEFLTFIMCG